MNLFFRFVQFFRTDVIWVATGQIVALIVGLISLKIFTNLFSAEKYAYIALMMAMAGWIWAGLYQPLNQTIFRFYPLADKQGWQQYFVPYVLGYEKKLVLLIGLVMTIFLTYGVMTNKADSFLLLVVLSACMGVIYGCIHGVVSFFLAQKKRKQVALLQSFDGLFRLSGGLVAFYGISQTEYATATGMVFGGCVFFILVMTVFFKKLSFQKTMPISIDMDNHKSAFRCYFNQMFVVMILNASVIHLDKWLLFFLMGGNGFGKYAVIYMLAMTIATILYVFFEMLGFPIIFNQQSVVRRKQLLTLLVIGYALCLSAVVFIIKLYGETILSFLTVQYVAGEYEVFTLLTLACGVLNFGRLLMVQGQVDKEPNKYWPAYFVLLSFFVGWCLLLVRQDGGFIAAQGFVMGTAIFVLIVIALNFKKTVSF